MKIEVSWRQEIRFTLDCEDDCALNQLVNEITQKLNIPASRMTLIINGFKFPKADIAQALEKPLSAYGNIKTLLKCMVVGSPIGAEFNNDQKDKKVIENSEKMLTSKPKLLPRGYQNLGATCYLGAALALLETAPGIKTELLQSASNIETDSLALSVHTLWTNKKLHEPAFPVAVHTALRKDYEQFHHNDNEEVSLMQQEDSDEALFCLLNSLANVSSQIKNSFEVKLITPQNRIEEHFKLNCYLGSREDPVNSLEEGIKLGLQSNEGTCIITGLPRLLIVHMVRFDWKNANSLAGTKACRAKINRRVVYGLNLKLNAFCTQELAAEDATYILCGIISHLGRSAESGHYIYWKFDSKTNSYLRMDDADTTVVAASSVNLQGGVPDAHCPYILLFERTTSL